MKKKDQYIATRHTPKSPERLLAANIIHKTLRSLASGKDKQSGFSVISYARIQAQMLHGEITKTRKNRKGPLGWIN
jgi:hypothetical protein